MNNEASAAQLEAEGDAKRLLQLNDSAYVNLAVQLRIADALETIADALTKKDNK